MSDRKTELRTALAAPKDARRAAVANAIRAMLEDFGLNSGEASQALACLGYRASRVQLVDLYMGAWFLEKITRDAGKYRRGAMTSIYASQAAIWAEASGQPDYGPESFKKAYEHWRRVTRGGGITNQYRAGFERGKRMAK